MSTGSLAHLRRYRVYREAGAAPGRFLCICAARDAKHAVRIARQHFRLTRTAWATPETITAHPTTR